MKKKPYLPKREPERVIWLNNFAAKLPGYAAMFGIPAGDVTAAAAMALIYSYVIGLINQSKTYTQELTKFKNLLSFSPSGTTLGPLPVLIPAAAPPLTAAGIFTFIGGIVQGIKSKKSVYTTAIGEDLGIIGDESDFDADNFTPKLKGKSMPGFADLQFVKDQTDGVNIYSRQQGEPEWRFLAHDTESPYHDTRPLRVPGTPEVREYRCRATLHDAEIGQWSDVVAVTFSG
ncbi:MAG: hypothetical protein ACHQNT_07015 [Bacteroidia bacterium]